MKILLMAKEHITRDKEVQVLRKQKATMMRQLHEKDELLKHCAAQEALLNRELDQTQAQKARSTINVEVGERELCKRFRSLPATTATQRLLVGLPPAGQTTTRAALLGWSAHTRPNF
jgi:hypothetical protein